jgi:hypothetical protein
MLIYLPSATISKFIHNISNRLRLIDTPGIFLAVGKGLDPMMISNLSTFMDDIIQSDVVYSVNKKKPGDQNTFASL